MYYRLKQSIFLLAYVVLGNATAAVAQDLGMHGPVFEIQERSLLEVIETRLKALQDSGAILTHQKNLMLKAKSSFARPSPNDEIKSAASYRAWLYDPSVTFEEAILTHESKKIIEAGTKLNPLDYLSWGEPLLLINGDDEAQVKWSLAQTGRIVLVKGAPLELEKVHQVPIFFDQAAKITERFNVTSVPARISQKGAFLQVEEIPLSSNDLTELLSKETKEGSQ